MKFHLEAGVDPAIIQLEAEGVSDLHLDRDGKLSHSYIGSRHCGVKSLHLPNQAGQKIRNERWLCDQRQPHLL